MSIRFENVFKAFGPKEILKGVTFEIPTGEIWFVLGKSGMGKSVTLKHMIGALKPDAGTVWIDRHEVSAMDADDLYRVRQVCGMVFQHPALLDSLTVYENIAFGLRTPQYIQRKGSRPTELEISERVKLLLSLVHLNEDILQLYPPELSYGMQKRVSMARTLAPEPDYVLFDEPTTGLDPQSTSSINALIQDLSRKLKVTSVVVSHDMNCALEIADKILFLDQGNILASGTPKEIARLDEPTVKAFFEETLSLLDPKERSKWS
jgi:phospholipid/cholesterol/gamma-HCH transport system ATP-binding protein